MKDKQKTEANLYHYTHELLTSHETLLCDTNRNLAFYKALERHITPESRVLDIGSGTGVWAIAAAKLGAKRVVAIEQDPLLIGLIRRLAQENGVGERVEAIAGYSTQVKLDPTFDVVVSETIGNLGFDEQIVPILMDARARFLKPGGILVPGSISLLAAAAHLKTHPSKIPTGIPLNFDYLEALNINIPLRRTSPNDLEILTNPVILAETDLTTVTSPPLLQNLTAQWKVEASAPVNCLAVWSQARLTEGIELTTLQTTSWSPVLYRIKPFVARSGDLEFKLTLTHLSNYWTVTLSNDQGQEVQSYAPALAATELLNQSPLAVGSSTNSS